MRWDWLWLGVTMPGITPGQANIQKADPGKYGHRLLSQVHPLPTGPTLFAKKPTRMSTEAPGFSHGEVQKPYKKFLPAGTQG